MMKIRKYKTYLDEGKRDYANDEQDSATQALIYLRYLDTQLKSENVEPSLFTLTKTPAISKTLETKELVQLKNLHKLLDKIDFRKMIRNLEDNYDL